MNSIFAIALPLVVAVSASAITINTVPIGNPGNLPDTRFIDIEHPNGVGAVSYQFNIGRTEVSNAQYVAFLNAVAADDLYFVYNAGMDGIVRSGSPGNYSYSIAAAPSFANYSYDNKPIAWISWHSAARFANWLHNGQPTGPQSAMTTEDGAYTLDGASVGPVTRNPAARWWIPSEDEWYKAAYHKNDGPTGNYWTFPTATISSPNNNPPANDTGNSANYNFTDYMSGNYPATDVGAYPLSVSAYGTSDQGGNEAEWVDRLFNNFYAGVRGGSYNKPLYQLVASYWEQRAPWSITYEVGFRVATTAAPIPEPATVVLCGLAAIGFYFRRPLR